MAGRAYKNKIPKSWVGKKVEIEWLDPAGYVQCELSKVRPCTCITNGVLLSIEKEFIIVSSSQYPEDTADPIVDATAITTGCVSRISRA